MKRRILTFLLSAAMMLTSVNVPAYAAGTGAGSAGEEVVIEETTAEAEPTVMDTSNEVVIDEPTATTENTETNVGNDGAATEEVIEDIVVDVEGEEYEYAEVAAADLVTLEVTPISITEEMTKSGGALASLVTNSDSKYYSIKGGSYDMELLLTPYHHKVFAYYKGNKLDDVNFMINNGVKTKVEKIDLPLASTLTDLEIDTDSTLGMLASAIPGTTYTITNIQIPDTTGATAKSKTRLSDSISTTAMQGVADAYITNVETKYNQVTFDAEVNADFDNDTVSIDVLNADRTDASATGDSSVSSYIDKGKTVTGLKPATTYIFQLVNGSTVLAETTVTTADAFMGTPDAVIDGDNTATKAKIKVTATAKEGVGTLTATAKYKNYLGTQVTTPDASFSSGVAPLSLENLAAASTQTVTVQIKEGGVVFWEKDVEVTTAASVGTVTFAQDKTSDTAKGAPLVIYGSATLEKATTAAASAISVKYRQANSGTAWDGASAATNIALDADKKVVTFETTTLRVETEYEFQLTIAAEGIIATSDAGTFKTGHTTDGTGKVYLEVTPSAGLYMGTTFTAAIKGLDSTDETTKYTITAKVRNSSGSFESLDPVQDATALETDPDLYKLTGKASSKSYTFRDKYTTTGSYDVIPNSVNTWEITADDGNGSEFTQYYTQETKTLPYKFDDINTDYPNAVYPYCYIPNKTEGDDSIPFYAFDDGSRWYYWSSYINLSGDYEISTDGVEFDPAEMDDYEDYIINLEGGKNYYLRTYNDDYDIVLATTEFSTPKGYADYKVEVTDVKYNKAAVGVKYYNDYNYSGLKYKAYYKAAADSDGWKEITLSRYYKKTLKDLVDGTTYVVKVDALVYCGDTYGYKVVKTQTVEFTTKVQYIHPTASATGGTGSATVTIDVPDGGSRNFKAIAWLERPGEGNEMVWVGKDGNGDPESDTYSITNEIPKNWSTNASGDQVVYFGKNTGAGTIEIKVPTSETVTFTSGNTTTLFEKKAPEGGGSPVEVDTEFAVKVILFQSYNNSWEWYVDNNNRRVIDGGTVTVKPAAAAAPVGPAGMYIPDIKLNKQFPAAVSEGYYTNAPTDTKSIYVGYTDTKDVNHSGILPTGHTIKSIDWKIADEKVASIQGTPGTDGKVDIKAEGKGSTELTVTVTTNDGTADKTWPVASAKIYVGDYRLYVRQLDEKEEEKTGDNDWEVPSASKDLTDDGTIYVGDVRHFAIGKFVDGKFTAETGITWGENSDIAKATDGALTGLRYGTTKLTATTAEGIEFTLDIGGDDGSDGDTIHVYNKVLGIVVDRITDSTGGTTGKYKAIQSGNTWTVAADETYTIECVPSPGYTMNSDTRKVLTAGTMGADKKITGGEYAIEAKQGDAAATIFTGATFKVPASDAGKDYTVTLTPVSAAASPITITIKALAKPAIETVGTTYMWMSTDPKVPSTLSMAPLPKDDKGSWAWEKPDTQIPAEGSYTFTAVYSGKNASGIDCYPLRDENVTVKARNVPNKTVVAGRVPANGEWSNIEYNRAKNTYRYFVAKDKSMTINLGASVTNPDATLNTLFGPEKTAATATDISLDAATGIYTLKPAASKVYDLNIEYYNVTFEATGGAWVAKKADAPAGKVTVPIDVTVGESLPYGSIKIDRSKPASTTHNFVWEDTDSTRDTDYDLVYKIGDKVGEKENEKITAATTAAVTLVVKDIKGAAVAAPKFKKITSSDPKVAAVPKKDAVKDSVLTLNIPKGAEGMAVITMVADDPAETTTSFAVKIRNYVPYVVKTNKTTLNVNMSYTEQNSPSLMQIVVPYELENLKDGKGENYVVNDPVLVKSNKTEESEAVAGIGLKLIYRETAGTGYSYDVVAIPKAGNTLAKKDSGSYFVRLETKMGGVKYFPVKITINDKMPKVTVKQNQAVNLFYTDTTKMDFALRWTGVAKPLLTDGVAMGYVTLTADKGVGIRDVVWRPKDAKAEVPSEKPANNDLLISAEETWNDNNVRVYSIRQNDPAMNGKKLVNGKDATDGYLYVYFDGYDKPVAVPFKTKTAYKVPKLKAEGSFVTTPDIGKTSATRPVSINIYPAALKKVAGKEYNWISRQWYTSCKDTLRLTSSNSAIRADMTRIAGATGEGLELTYTGPKAASTTITFFSDYWNEPLSIKATVKPTKPTAKLDPAKVVLNLNNPAEINQTGAYVEVMNAKSNSAVAANNYLNYSTLTITGVGNKAQDLIDKKLINIVRQTGGIYNSRTCLLVTLNNEKAISGLKKGSYKFKIGGTIDSIKMKDVTLTLQVLDKPAGVKLTKSGSIDLSKWNGTKNNKYVYNSAIKCKPKFSNLDSSAEIPTNTGSGLTITDTSGVAGGLFTIRNSNGIANTTDGKEGGYVFYIEPRTGVTLYAGNKYEVTVTYTITDTSSTTNGKRTFDISDTFTIIPKQSKPKATAKPGKVTIYASQDNRARFNVYTPDFTTIIGAGKEDELYYDGINDTIYYDIDNDGVNDIKIVMYTPSDNEGGKYTTNCRGWFYAQLLNPEAFKSGKSNKFTVPVWLTGPDGTPREATSFNISVVTKK